MAWIKIESKPAKAKLRVALRVSRQRLRNNEFLYLVRIRIAEAVLKEAGFKLGSEVDLLRGVSEDAGKVRVQATTGNNEPFQITRFGSSKRLVGQIAFAAPLLGLRNPPVGPSVSVSYRVEPLAIDIVLPRDLARAAWDGTENGSSSDEGVSTSPWKAAINKPAACSKLGAVAAAKSLSIAPFLRDNPSI